MRYRSEDQGFPLFGQMKLTNDRAADGQWSFEFDLEGGSMAARTLPGTAPVLPLASYTVSAKVQTEGLKHARARLVAWFVDSQGRVIPESRVQSRLVGQTHGWEDLSVEVPGDYEHAADLILELQVLQPRQFQPSTDQYDIPKADDIRGRVWFDSVEIAHLPQIRLKTNQTSGVYVQPNRPVFEIVIRDHINDDLHASIRILDLQGNTRFQEQFAAPNGHSTFVQEAPIDECGWYRAILEVHGSNTLIGERELTFVVVPKSTGGLTRDVPQFGIEFSANDADHIRSTEDLLRTIDPACSVIHVWDSQLTKDKTSTRYQNVRTALDRLALRNSQVVLDMSELPDSLANILGIENWQVLEMFSKNASLWRPWLDELLVNFGQEIQAWQIGSGRTPEAFWNSEDIQQLEMVRSALSGFVSEPRVYVEQPLEIANIEGPGIGTLRTIPPEWPDEGVMERLSAESPGGKDFIRFERFNDNEASAEAKVIQLATRVLWTWRAGAQHMLIDSPWSWSNDQPAMAVPDATFGPWLELSRELAGRSFGGEVQIGDRVHCWIIRGRRNDQSALALWTDDSGPGLQRVQLQLGESTADVTDIHGNTRAVYPVNGVHNVMIGRLPVFIRNIDVHLAEFRGMFSIEPQFVPAESSLHEHEVVVHNPWDSPITVTVRLHDNADWHILPQVLTVPVAAGQTARIPITIVLDRNVIAGVKDVHADVTVSAETEVNLQLRVPIEIGLTSVQMSVTPMFTRNMRTGGVDVVLSMTVTNVGNDTLRMDAVAQAPGLPQNRTKLPPLEPGETLHRRLILPGSGMALEGRTVRLGLVGREGFTRLNQLVKIPALSNSAKSRLAGTDDSSIGPPTE
ncbi:MAG TPA: hypothetical protein VG711_01955 [Phycisphaerales bacterium]|nr:hypothetical protein [Phycisphaerales bacterium]